MKSRSVPRRDNGTLLCLACCSERGRTRRGISPSGRDASLTLSMTLLSFRAYAKNLQLLLQEILWGYSPQNDKCCYCLEGDSSSLTVVRMTSLVISNVCERYYVSLLGRRIFGAIHLRMTYFLTRDSSRQISCYYRLAWDSSLHDRFVQNDSQMSFRANARNPPILPFCLDILYRLLTMRGSLLVFFFLQL